MRRSVLVTGASSGIGAASARVLVQRGFRVWAGVRDENRAPAGTTPIPLDVTDPAQIAGAVRRIAAEGGLYGLVNNAGIAVSAPLESVPLDALREQFEVNVFGTLAVTQAMIPLLRRSLGRVVMISSISGRNAAAFIGPYAASKYALEALSDALRAELAPSGIDVSLIEPGAVKTPIWERGAARGLALADTMAPVVRARYDADVSLLLRASAAFAAHGIAPERVAEAVARALIARRPKTRYLVGTEARLQLAARRFVPDRLRDRLIRAALRHAAR
ncbi:MAG TPA: SDR family oxidoreductase [Candidatus Acidoferrum sp.]|nr:SDR family oxidoreductase [Candidatus Acidoferrum sp.]